MGQSAARQAIGDPLGPGAMVFPKAIFGQGSARVYDDVIKPLDRRFRGDPEDIEI
jgi:hypothetical protein